MSERLRFESDADLETSLVSLGQQVAYPPTPDVASAVRQRLRAPRRTRTLPERIAARVRSAWPARRTGLAIAMLAVVLALGVLLALDPGARTALADRLGLRGVTISQVPFVPGVTPTVSPSPTRSSTGTVGLPPVASATPIPLGERLNLGQRITLAEAAARVPYRILTPTVSELGAPDEVYLGDQSIGDQVALIYHPRSRLPPAGENGVGLLLTEFRGDINPGFDPVGKMAGPDTRVERLTVNGRQGYWLEGHPHQFFYRDLSGAVQTATIRLAGNTLLWEQGTLTLRLEAALTRDEALRIARSIQ